MQMASALLVCLEHFSACIEITLERGMLIRHCLYFRRAVSRALLHCICNALSSSSPYVCVPSYNTPATPRKTFLYLRDWLQDVLVGPFSGHPEFCLVNPLHHCFAVGSVFAWDRPTRCCIHVKADKVGEMQYFVEAEFQCRVGVEERPKIDPFSSWTK